VFSVLRGAGMYRPWCATERFLTRGEVMCPKSLDQAGATPTFLAVHGADRGVAEHYSGDYFYDCAPAKADPVDVMTRAPGGKAAALEYQAAVYDQAHDLIQSAASAARGERVVSRSQQPIAGRFDDRIVSQVGSTIAILLAVLAVFAASSPMRWRGLRLGGVAAGGLGVGDRRASWLA
jgi:hypothetical protein